MQKEQSFNSNCHQSVQFIRKQTHKLFNEQFKMKFKKQYNEENIYTVVCSIGIINKNNHKIQVITVANGTKSLPYTVYSQNKTSLLKDMHAEILAIKAFRIFIAEQISKPQSEYIIKDREGKKKVFNKAQYQIFLYSSEPFCGDCSINEDQGLFSGGKPLKFFNKTQILNEKFHKHILRTKPSRLDLPQNKRSLSLSCSDKLALYNIIGIQGKWLFHIIKPIYINLFVVECKISKKKTIQQGLNFIYRLSNLRNQSQTLIKRKIFNIVINNQQRKITNQFNFTQPQIVCLQKMQIRALSFTGENVQLNQFKKKNEKQGFQLSLIYLKNLIQWINNKTGLPQGCSLNNYMKKGKVSSFCKKRFLQLIYSKKNILNYLSIQNDMPQNKQFQQGEDSLRQIFKYNAVKDRIKNLFGIWTDDFKTKNIQNSQIANEKQVNSFNKV